MTAGEIPGMWARAGCYVMEWDDFGRCVEVLRAQVDDSGFAPTAICAIARGGLLPAAYLATTLAVERSSSVRVRRTVDDTRYAAKVPPEPVPVHALELRPDDRLLVVDDIVGTGATAEVVLEALRPRCGEVRLATLVRNHLAPEVADYCAAVIDDWIIFPWEPAMHDRPPGSRPFRLNGAGR